MSIHFFVRDFDTGELFNDFDMVLHFYNTCLNSFNISPLFSDRIIICSTFLEFSEGNDFGFTVLSVTLLPLNSPATSAAL